MNVTATHSISDEQAIRFFQELKDQLHYTSLRKIMSLVRMIFSNLRGTYSEEQSKEIIACTPRVLQLLFNSTPATVTKKTYHLDELVDVVYQEDQQKTKGLFRSEIDALKTVSFALRKAEKLYKPAKVQLLNHALASELHDVAEEEVAF